MALPKISDQYNRGFTLVEIMIVASIFVFIMAFAMPMGISSYRNYSFRNERDIFIGALQKARGQAMNNVCLGSVCQSGKRHGVYFETGKYTIFQGDSYSSRDIDQDEEISAGYTVSFSGDIASEVIFSNLLENVSPTGTITIIDPSNSKASDITINREGRISWTN